MLAVPLLAVYERTHGSAAGRSSVWVAIGLALFLLGVVLGISAWRALGRWYIPDPDVLPGQRLITGGPYRLVRHPMYTALLLSLPALPLLLRSLWGLALSLLLIVPAPGCASGRKRRCCWLSSATSTESTWPTPGGWCLSYTDRGCTSVMMHISQKMRIVYVDLSILVLLAVYILWRVRREYKAQGKLSAQTALGVWAVYLLHVGLTVFTAWHAFWPLPISKRVSVAIGAMLMFFGLALSMAGIIAFRSFKRMSGLEADKLVISGAYRWSRNPQNVGWGLVLLGIALIGGSAIALILVALFWLILHVYLVLVEEEYLEQVFGEEYRRYRSKTPRYLGWPKSE